MLVFLKYHFNAGALQFRYRIRQIPSSDSAIHPLYDLPVLNRVGAGPIIKKTLHKQHGPSRLLHYSRCAAVFTHPYGHVACSTGRELLMLGCIYLLECTPMAIPSVYSDQQGKLRPEGPAHCGGGC